MAKRLSRSGDELPLPEVYLYKKDAEEGLSLLFSQAEHFERFALMSAKEIQQLFIKRTAELELQATFSLMTSLEAFLQLDFHDRIEKRYKDPLSRYFRDSYKQPKRISFESDIINGWEAVYPETRRFFQKIKVVLRYRHWLAHGRYWLIDKPKISFEELYELAEIIQNTMYSIRSDGVVTS